MTFPAPSLHWQSARVAMVGYGEVGRIRAAMRGN
jgi:hypothetical protein